MWQQTFKSYLSKSFIPLTTFLLGGVLVWSIYFFGFIGQPASSRALRLSQTNYPLINPLLLCNLEPSPSNEDKKLGSLVENFIDDRVKKNLVDSMSVYLVNYGTGKWVGVNENERYDPASMLKVPLMLAYYKIAETDPGILNEETSFTGDDQNIGEYFMSKNNILPGKMYTIEDLIKSMVVNSDNTAGFLLEKYVDENSLYNIYTDLRLPVPANDPNIEYLSTKLYAYFFRILYNGTYLDRKYSEQALEYLGETNGPGIKDGVPDGVVVSHKFGERSIYDQYGETKDKEFHDCGIVYKKDGPYLLCVMSRGNDFDQLAKNVSDLSALVYENIGK